MTAGNHTTSVPAALRVLAGVEAGVIAGLAMLGWVFLGSTLLDQSVWTVPNLLGSIVNGDGVLRRGFGWAALSGLALHFFTSGVVGILFGLIVAGVRSRRRAVLLGIITGLIWFYFSNALVWRKLGALAWIYLSPRSLLVAHIIFGAVLGLQPPRRGM